MKKFTFAAGALLLLAATATATAGEKPAPPPRLRVVTGTWPPAVAYQDTRVTVVSLDPSIGHVKVILHDSLCSGTDTDYLEAARTLLELFKSLPDFYNTVAVVNTGWCPFQMVTTKQKLEEILTEEENE